MCVKKCVNISAFRIDNQQYATILIYLLLISSTCFERCFRPSAGAYKCNYSFWYCPPMLLLLLGGTDLSQFHPTRNTSQKQHQVSSTQHQHQPAATSSQFHPTRNTSQQKHQVSSTQHQHQPAQTSSQFHPTPTPASSNIGGQYQKL